MNKICPKCKKKYDSMSDVVRIINGTAHCLECKVELSEIKVRMTKREKLFNAMRDEKTIKVTRNDGLSFTGKVDSIRKDFLREPDIAFGFCPTNHLEYCGGFWLSLVDEIDEVLE
jgi:hypothetical protein